MKKLLLLLFVIAELQFSLQAQNAIVGSGFSSGWGSTCTNPTGTDYTYLNTSSGGTFTTGDLTPKGTGNQYWRLAIGWSGTYYQINSGSTTDLAVTPGTKNSSVVSCAEMGAWYRNVSSLNNRYVFKTLNAGTTPSGTWVFFELGGASATVSSVSQNPVASTVFTVDPVVVTATLSGAFPTGQGAYLRFSTDNFATSTVVPMTGSGTSYKATIPAQVANNAVKYYVFTSGSGLNISATDADLYSINWNAGSLNGGSNYSYSVTTDPNHSFIAKYLFDFTTLSSDANGALTTGADANGNYWNNLRGVGAIAGTDFNNGGAAITASNFVNSSNAGTSYSLSVNSGSVVFSSNSTGGGALQSPYTSQFAEPDLAIATATKDYIYTQAVAGTVTKPYLKISGLNNAKRYRFKIFGCRNTNADRTSVYTITGITSFGGSSTSVAGSLPTSTATGVGGTAYFPDASTPASNFNLDFKLYSQTGYTVAGTYFGNNNSVYTSGYFYPVNQEITISVHSSSTSNYAYVNCMKMEEFKGEQTLSFGALAAKTTSDADYLPGATASSGLTVSYSSSNTAVATILNGKIHIVGTGTTTITASQTGDANYEAATSVQQSLTVSASALTPQSITFNALSAKTYGDAPFTLSATASSGLSVSYSSSNTSVATISGNTVTIIGAGTTDITASQSGDATYAAASSVTQTLTVNKISQTIGFGTLADKTDADIPYAITATSTSGLTVSFSSSNTSVATVSGNIITIVGAGSTTITASQSGDSHYSVATNVQQTLTVSSTVTLKQSLLIDFGPNETTNGDLTVNPDANGNYWNNITPAAGGVGVSAGTAYNSLKNSANLNTGYSLTFTNSGFISNGKLNGGLQSPQSSQFGTNSELAIQTATIDYIYTTATSNGPVITFSNLSPAKKYRFKIFGSRNSNSDRAGQYTIQGAGSAFVGNIQSSTTAGLGGTVYIGQKISYPANLNILYALAPTDTLTKAVTFYGNNSSILYSGLVQPDASGNITLTTITTTPSVAYAYINCLKIEEYDIPGVDVTSIAVTGSDISVSNATTQMSVVYTPSNATPHTISWSVDDTSIASINSNGLLTPLKNGTVTVTASLLENSTTISGSKQISISNQITEMYISGTATTNGDNPATALQMNASTGTTGSIIPGQFEFATTLNGSGTLKFYTSRTGLNAPVYGMGATTGTIQQNGTDITPNVSGTVLIRIYLASNTYKIYPVSPLKISQMGSSVSYGTGAVSNQGYPYLFNQLLSQRYTAGKGANWTISNISVPGNTTVDVLNRWDTDLLNDGSKYVVYALSLGNEGIMTGGQPIFDQFKNNLQLLIAKAKAVGKIPVIANCYSRGDYGLTQYNYVKQMNLLIHQWDVASINLLGSLDDGAGKWPLSPVNYQYDLNHPNDAGHTELKNAIVPSLYDAILAGKAQPQKKGNTYLAMGKAVTTDRLNFSPDNTVHSFTTTFDIKTTGSGIIGTFSNNSSTGTLQIESSGVVTYISPFGGSVSGSVTVNDGQWHKITLTHYYAWGKTMLYTDNTLCGNITENLTPTTFVLNDANSPDNISYREWMFFRAGMNADEVTSLNSGNMLKSSLELYSPLDGLNINSGDALVNLAQSTNTIQRTGITTSIKSGTENLKISVFPNPVSDKLCISGLKSTENLNCKIFRFDGSEVISDPKIIDNQINVSLLTPSVYFLFLNNKDTQQSFRLNFIKK